MFDTEQITATAPAPEALESPHESAPQAPEGTPPARTLADMVTSQLDTLRECHSSVLLTDAVEAIHKMRVTTRRLQASLDLIQTGPLAMEAKRIKRRLRRWRRMLSEVRNYDVFLVLVDKEASSRRGGQREQFELLSSILKRRRARRATRIRKRLERISIDAVAAKLGLRLTPLVSNPAAPGDESGSSESNVRDVEAEQLPDGVVQEDDPVQDDSVEIDETAVAVNTADRLDQRLAEFQLLAAQSHPARNPQELHQLRIAAKRLRYLMEIASALGYGNATAALIYLRSLQDRIGEWHDLQALEEEIVGVVTRRKFLERNLAESSIMLRAAAHLRKKKEALISRLFPVRVPKTVPVTSERLAKSLRRRPPAAEL